MESYDLIVSKELNDLNCKGEFYRHKKSGARVVIIKNDDNNKVFSIGFRTPSTASTGVQHITEHSTLCGSRKYPSKEPFVELAKGSLNTFLNAMTYPDKTIYPVASCNDVDFKNLMDVYLDAVFYPNIFSRPEIFKQEGWHYESDGKNVKLNGVVFNEMKGAYSAPDDVLQNGIFESLFPDTPYRFDAGGNPEIIPTLTYEDFLEFHKEHYHPANSYIYLYGDIDAEEMLKYLDEEYLCDFDINDFDHDTSIPRQGEFNEPVKATFPYAVMEDEDLSSKTYLSYSWTIDTALNDKLCIAMDVLDYVLISAPGAVLKQAFLDEALATDISSSFETSLFQPVYSIIAKNAKTEDEDRFREIIENVLENAVQNGFDDAMLNAGINYLEFRYREADFGSYPKGLIYNLAMLDSWMYDEKQPFIHIDSGKIFDWFKTIDKQEFFKDVVDRYLLKNKNAASVTLIPDTGLDKKRKEQEAARINAFTEKLSKEKLEELVKDSVHLKEYQDTPSTQEELETIPLLSISDIDKEPVPVEYDTYLIRETRLIYEDIFTNGIDYVTFAFDCRSVPEHLLPYLGLLNIVMGLMDTADHKYADLTSEINIHTGGIYSDISMRRNVNNYSDVRIFFDIKAKVLEEKLEFVDKLTREMILNTDYSDRKRLKDIIAKTRSQLEDAVLSAGHTTASTIALAQVSNSRHYASVTRGYDFYKFLEKIDDDFNEEADDIIEKLNALTKLIFSRRNLIINLTADKEALEKARPVLEEFVENIPLSDAEDIPLEFTRIEKKNIALTSPSQVNYVARAGNFTDAGYKYTGALRVLKTIFSYDYLWNNVRVKGGAYGCMTEFGRSGDSYMVSYRDPNIEETNDIFDKAPEYVKTFDASPRDMTKYIIGTIGALDTPLTPSAKGIRAFDAYLKNVTTDMLRKERKEVLNADVEKIRELSDIVQATLDENILCVVGNSEKIEAHKELFDQIKPLS